MYYPLECKSSDEKRKHLVFNRMYYRKVPRVRIPVSPQMADNQYFQCFQRYYLTQMYYQCITY